MDREFLLPLMEHKSILLVEKDIDLRFIDCNESWLHMSGLKKKDKALGLTDKDCVWAPFSHIAESYEKDVLTGKAYPKIGPAFVEDDRFCWLQDYKWPKYDKDNKIIGLKVVAYEITDQSISNALSLFTKNNRFDVNDYNIEQPIEDELSKREKEVLFYLCHGLPVKRIALFMGLSTRTVETHINNIKIKFNCHSKSQIIEYAVAKKYVSILPHNLLINNKLKNIYE